MLAVVFVLLLSMYPAEKNYINKGLVDLSTDFYFSYPAFGFQNYFFHEFLFIVQYEELIIYDIYWLNSSTVTTGDPVLKIYFC